MKTFRRLIIVILTFSVLFLSYRVTKLEQKYEQLQQQHDNIYYDSNDRMSDLEYYVEQLINDLVERQGVFGNEL